MGGTHVSGLSVSLESRFASTPLVHQLCATLGELASMRWRKGACARCGGELTPDPPPRPSCEASVTAPLFWRWSCFHKPHRGGKRGVGLAWLMPKLVFFLPRHTAPGDLVSQGSLFLTLTSVWGWGLGGAVLACHSSRYQARKGDEK